MKKEVHRATFNLSGKKVPGILTLKGRRSTLELWNDEFFHVFGGTLHGTTADAKAVSVLDCLESHPTSTSGKEHSGFRGSVRFGLVTVGHGEHLDADAEAVIAVDFSFEELEWLSRTGVNGPYSYIPDPDPALIESLRQHKPDYMPDVGDGAMLAYFGGETTVLPETPTEIGTVSINRGLNVQVGGGVSFTDMSSVTIDFDTPLTVHETSDRMNALRHFFGLAMGYLPVVKGAKIATSRREGRDTRQYPVFQLDLHCPAERPGSKERLGHRLLDCNGQPRKDELRTVLTSWFTRNANQERRDANWRFFDCFLEGRHFSINRTIAAANMFDLLPKTDWPHSKMKDLKRKIRHKAEPVRHAIGANRLARLEEVVDHAVDCRNHYVHGTPAKLDYNRMHIQAFLTDTLEFVYGVAELIECGWNAQWLADLQPGDHPFASYLKVYDLQLNRSGI